MNDKSTEHFKQKDELIPYGVESDQPLQTFMSLEESVMFEDDIQKTIIEAEPDLLEKIKTQIENNIRDLKTVVDTMNKLRGKFEIYRNLTCDLTYRELGFVTVF